MIAERVEIEGRFKVQDQSCCIGGAPQMDRDAGLGLGGQGNAEQGCRLGHVGIDIEIVIHGKIQALEAVRPNSMTAIRTGQGSCPERALETRVADCDPWVAFKRHAG